MKETCAPPAQSSSRCAKRSAEWHKCGTGELVLQDSIPLKGFSFNRKVRVTDLDEKIRTLGKTGECGTRRPPSESPCSAPAGKKESHDGP
jgi:hypothetical protein